MTCTQSGCSGTIADGYCDTCGMAPVAGASAPPSGASPSGASPSGATATQPRAGAGGAAGVVDGARCTQPGCVGTIADGYCDTCGMAAAGVSAGVSLGGSAAGATAGASASVVTSRGAAGATTGAAGATSGPPTSRTGRTVSSERLGSMPIGSARTGATRPTRRLGSTRQAARLGVGLTTIPPVPPVDPQRALMNPAEVPEDKRYCGSCQAPVGRGREGQPGRSKGFCPKCRTSFDFTPRLAPGMLIGGQYEVAGCLAHGGMGWIYLARDRNVNGRWVVLKGLLNAGDPDAYRAAVSEKQFLAEVEHPLICEIYNFVTAADGASYIVMEYIGGQSLNNLVKTRAREQKVAFASLPPDQTIAYMIEVLPAFSYLHGLGLLYCDFKPANLIQVGDGIKLIDLGGVRRVDDDQSPIYGTVGFQAPEVASEGTSVASDIYTIGRTMAVLLFEFRNAGSTYLDHLPGPADVPLFAEQDSLYRLLLKACAKHPEDRFQSADEMREQLIGVLREITATGRDARSTPSALFETPTVAGEHLEVADLPRLRVDPHDAMASWIAGVTSDDPLQRRILLADAPTKTPAVDLAIAEASLGAGDVEGAEAAAARLLHADPWDWRPVWIHGLVALKRGDAAAAVAAFNTVYGQVPGELAPKLALARACELAGEADLAGRLYEVCARTDASYTAPARFGQARLAAIAGDQVAALYALEGIPTVSRAYGTARQRLAALLAQQSGSLSDLAAAATELDRSTASPPERSALRISILSSALDLVRQRPGSAPPNAVRIVGVGSTERELRLGLEAELRAAARLTDDVDARIALVDRANAVRPRTLV